MHMEVGLFHTGQAQTIEYCFSLYLLDLHVRFCRDIIMQNMGLLSRSHELPQYVLHFVLAMPDRSLFLTEIKPAIILNGN